MSTFEKALILRWTKLEINSNKNTLDLSKYLTVNKADIRYIHKPINELINMNQEKVTDVKKSENKNDVCTIKNLVIYYRKGTTFNMENTNITNLKDGVDNNDAIKLKQSWAMYA